MDGGGGDGGYNRESIDEEDMHAGRIEDTMLDYKIVCDNQNPILELQEHPSSLKILAAY
jgi:hypothetical protein